MFAIGNETVPDGWQDFYASHGFYAPGPRYFILRPEVRLHSHVAISCSPRSGHGGGRYAHHWHKLG